MAVGYGKSQEYFDAQEVMPAAERAKFLDRKLAETVAHAYRHAPATRALFDQAGISPESIKTAADLERVPITRKTDIIEAQKREPPYGGFLAVPPADIERVFISPGPVYEPLHSSSIKWFARSFYAAGFRRGDIVVNTFTYHMSPAGMLFHEALRDCGATVVVMGTGNTEPLIQAMLALKVTGFVGTPTFLMTVIKRAEELGHSVQRDFVLKRAWFTGEMLAPSLRRTFEQDYGIATAQAYAVTEPGGAIAYECASKNGMHFMDDYVIEIVDPETGQRLGPGEIGEIVVTPIHNKTWGLVRFGTGDMSSYRDEPCACGRTSPRLTGIVGRTGDAVKVRGMFVVARQAEQAITGLEAVSRFQLIVTRRGERDELALRAELKNEAADKPALAAEINRRFQELCRVRLDGFEFIAPGTIGEKEPRILDRRQWE